MTNPYRRILLTLALGTVAFTAPACTSEAAQSSRATTTVPGRRIDARGDGPVSVQNFGRRAVVSIPSHELTIEGDRVLLDGEDLAKLPAGATHVGVNVDGGQLTVTADGVPVATKQLGK